MIVVNFESEILNEDSVTGLRAKILLINTSKFYLFCVKLRHLIS